MKRLSISDIISYGIWRRQLSVGLMLCLLFVGSGCTSEELSDSTDGNPIVFRGDAVTASRATVTSTLRKIGVFGYSHEGNFTDAPALRVPDYFLNQAVIDRADDGVWSYSGVKKYWPREGINLSFFAYAPYIDVENTFTLYPAAIANTGEPIITYTVPANIYNQVDLLWSNAIDQVYTTNNGQVDFDMNHALTRIDFAIKLNDKEQDRPYIVTIKNLTVENIIGSGKLNLSKSSGDNTLWTTERPVDNSGWSRYSLTPSYGGGLQELVFDARTIVVQTNNPYQYNNMLVTGQHLMLIPQRIDSQADGLSPAQITLSYSFTNAYNGETFDKDEIITLSQPTLAEWKPGQGITYLIKLSLVEGTVIELDVEGFITGTPWDDVNSGSPIQGSVG